MKNETVIVDGFSTLHEAQMAKDRLSGKGIESFITGENGLVSGNYAGGYKLNVKETESKKAYEILAGK